MWIFRGDEPRPRRGRDVDIPRGRVAQIIRGDDGRTRLERRGQRIVSARVDSAAAATWIFRGDESRRATAAIAPSDDGGGRSVDRPQ